MKKTYGKKLTLTRETVAALNPDVLGDVVGGQVSATISVTTRHLCPTSKLGCPPPTLAVCMPLSVGGGAKGGE